MRTKLTSSYTFVDSQDEELVFGGYSLVFTSAFYQSATVAYAMAYDSSSKSYLIKFDWTKSNANLQLVQGFDPTPNSAGSTGSRHRDSLIYQEDLAATGNYPVKGFIVGGSAAIWSYNDACDEPDFGVSLSYYQLLNAGKKYGFLDRIELDQTSCKKEDVTVTTAALISGRGRDDATGIQLINDLTPYGGEASIVYGQGLNVYDLTTASNANISPGGWESSQVATLTACSARSASLQTWTLDSAVFATDNAVEYQIGSGGYNAAITTDWLVSGGACTMSFADYKAFEQIQETELTSNNLSLTAPTTANKNVGLTTSDSSLNQEVHKVSVLAIAATWQCKKDSFTVRPYYCELATYSSAAW